MGEVSRIIAVQMNPDPRGGPGGVNYPPFPPQCSPALYIRYCNNNTVCCRSLYPLQVLVTDSCCYKCGEDVTCTVRDVLYQPDYGGNDYEDVSFCLNLHLR